MQKQPTLGASKVPPMSAPKLTTEMMKAFKTLTCDCGGMLFQEGIVLKKISPLVSPSGKEELYPLEVLICRKCGKVPSELDTGNILPADVLAKQLQVLDKMPSSFLDTESNEISNQ